MDVDAPGTDRRADGQHRPSGRASGASGDPLIGRLLDRRYRIGARIARGGMASVYEATDIRLDRTVAVKVMHVGLGDDDEFAARFVREARSAARLSHTHVVGVFDQGEDDGTVFLVMEYVSGHTLRDEIRAHAPMPPLRALELLEPVLSALAAAHRAGLVHRDVKPENVLISEAAAPGSGQGAGLVKVADFGLAKAVGTDTHHTATGGILIGTVSYLAPEVVIDGRSDARADVYAAGVVLYEMLTGHKPHEGESPIAVAYKHVHEDVAPPSRDVPGLPAYVDALVARATSRDRDNRPTDAGVLLHQVHRVHQALAEGVTDDPELTADLRPPPSHLAVPDDLSHLEDEPHDATRERLPALPPAALSSAALASAAEPTTALVAGLRGVADEDRPFFDAYADDGYDDELDPAPYDEPAPAAPAGPRPPRRTRRSGRPRRRRSRRGLVAVLLALLIAVGGGAAAWWFGDGRYEATPGVIGMSQPAAVAKLTDAGLRTTVTREVYSETAAKGVVLEMDPDPGTRILHDATVGLVISRGKERYAVPAVRGSSEDAAQDALRAGHLAFGRAIGRYSETVAKGTVLRSRPASGTPLKNGATVDLVVSKGRQPIEVPDLDGQDADEAQTRLEGLGLDVTRSSTYDDTVPVGDVISQDPDSGTLFAHDTVSLEVSLGPEMVTVPDVVREPLSKARKTLEDAGFKVSVFGISTLGYVFRTNPSAGTSVVKGATIRLFVI